MKTIRYCCNNEKRGMKQVYKSLKNEFPELKQERKDCLGHCKMCKQQCFVAIGKKHTLCAESSDQIYQQLRALIEQSEPSREPVLV